MMCLFMILCLYAKHWPGMRMSPAPWCNVQPVKGHDRSHFQPVLVGFQHLPCNSIRNEDQGEHLHEAAGLRAKATITPSETGNGRPLATCKMSCLAGFANRCICRAFCIETACRVRARAILYSLLCTLAVPSFFWPCAFFCACHVADTQVSISQNAEGVMEGTSDTGNNPY